MIVMISGAAALLAGSVGFSLFRFKTADNTIETFIRETRPLSAEAQAALNKTYSPGGKPGSNRDLHLSMRDLYTIFWNSRKYVCVANRARLCVPEDMELPDMCNIMQEDHSKVRWQILMSVVESFVGRLGHYTRELLWTYGEELELLDRISQKCGPLEGRAIQAIL